MEEELAVVDQAGPNDYDTVEELAFSRGETREVTDVNSKTEGWSITVITGFEIGGDAQGGKIIGGLEVGAHGDYTVEKIRTKSSTIGAEHETEVLVPRGEIAELVQTVRTGEVEMDVEDLIVLKLGWKIADWKKRNNSYLNDHAGWAKKGKSKSRWHWDCLDTYDFISAMEGNNPRYPNLTSSFARQSSIKPHVDWLKAENNRLIRVRSTVTYKNGIWAMQWFVVLVKMVSFMLR